MKGPGPRSSSWIRVDAIVRKELRDYRRNRFVLGTMTAMALLFITMPSVLSAYSVVGEREQGTREPALTTPIRREEFLIAKALAAFVPTLVIAYAVFGIFLGAAAPFASRR
jgi:ABC-type transport system involved in multi-copper enzyme maturation permease subunit